MPRKTAPERHTDSAPDPQLSWPPAGADLIDALIAVHHPTRRQLYEILITDGPATVGQLADRTGVAVGSVSHHLKRLHRAGFAVPAPELAQDTRQSWWRGIRRRLSWSADDFGPGSVARDIAEVAERNNFQHHLRATTAWMRDHDGYRPPWNDLGYVADTLVRATPDQFADLQRRLDELLRDWDASCRAEAEEDPDADRQPVRAIVRLFPGEPGPRA